jgi:hypothetical protein
MKRIANLMDAQMPSPPAVQIFVSLLRDALGTNASSSVDALLGALPGLVKKKPLLPRNHAAVKAFLDYFSICETHNVKFATLDDVFVGWARYAITASQIYATDEQVESCLQVRQEKAGDAKLQSMAVLSFRTYVNSVASTFKSVAGENHIIVPSSLKQFPQYNEYMGPLLVRARAKQTVDWGGDPVNNVLQPEELLQVVATVATSRPFDLQRKHLLCLGFATGYRGEVLRRLLVESLKPSTDAGRKIYTIVVGTMKNIPGDLNHVDEKLFTLMITEGVNPQVCPVLAIEAQVALLAKHGAPLPAGAPNYLFRSMKCTTMKKIPPQPISKEFFRGISNWVSGVLERPVTFKDLARRAAMSRLVNSGDICRWRNVPGFFA